MYLENVLLKQGFELVQDKPIHGPDILIIDCDSIIWLEAVAPYSGTGPDAVLDIEKKKIVTSIPDEKIILRLTNAVTNKKQ